MRMPKAATRTGVVFFPAFDWSISPTHPEREERLLYTRDQLFEEGIFDIEGVIEYQAQMARIADADRVHACYPSTQKLATTSHLISAGGAITAARAVLDGEVEKAFALVRPPGHHAMRVVRGLRGFCIINIEAVMVEHIRRHYGQKRVAIIDTDCHHGDGTQDIYWNDPNTLFISLHQDGRTLYPGSGFPGEFGGPSGYGTTLNIPLPPGTCDEGYLYVMDNFVLPVLEDWQPDLIINSAGQDNHFTDPITDMGLSAEGYAEITRRLNPHLAGLEGGYSVQAALPYVNTGILLAMAGLDTSRVIEPRPNPRRQRPESDQFIEKVCDLMFQRYEHRDALAEQEFGDKLFVETERSVFHDEAGISEEQLERAKRCPDCAGFVTLDSQGSDGRRVFLINAPLGACNTCIDEAVEAYETTDSGYDLVSFQNRPEDLVLQKRD